MEWEQERYDLKRQLSEEQATRRYLDEELESLQQDVKEKSNEVEVMKKLIKEQNKLNENTILEWKSKVDVLEKEMENEKQKNMVSVDKLTKQVEHLQSELNKRDSSLSVVKEIKEKNEILERNFETNETEYKKVLEDKVKLIDELIEAKYEINNALLCKREELSTYVERCNELQGEIVLLQVENNNFKSAPENHRSKGNSMFAEVDDNRKALKKNLDELSEKYNVLKKKLKSKNSELIKLRAEYSSLLQKLMDISSRHEENESDIIHNYQSRIKDLETTNERLKKEMSLQVSTGEGKEIQGIFAFKNKEIETLGNKVEELSRTVFFQNENIFSLRRDLEKFSTRAAYEQSEKLRLQEELCKISSEK